MQIPLLACSVQAGFPSPAEDYLEKNLSLDEYLIHHPAATVFVRVSGVSMIDEGIVENDILVVDRSLKAKHDDIVIACINSEFTLKKLHIENSMKLYSDPRKLDQHLSKI